MQEKESVQEKEALSIVDYLIILLKWKKVIIIVTLLITIISVILYFFVFDSIYYSSATIKSSGKGSSLLSGIGGLGDIGGGIGDLVGGASSNKELSYYIEVLNSRRCLEPLINKFDLMKRDNVVFLEDEIKSFQKEKLVVEIEKISGLLSIGIYDKDKVMAKDMVEFLINELNNINIELSVQNAKNNRVFIEKRYFQAKDDLTAAEDSLKNFQLIYGVAPDLQIKAAAQSEFSLEAELKTEEVKLDVLKKILSPDQVEVKTQQAKIEAIRSQISSIQNSTDLNEMLRLGNSPQIVLSFLRLQRDIEIQGKILTFLLPVYEQAKIDEKKETPTILILDKPFVAEKKTKPKRLSMVLLSAFLSFCIISICILVYDLNIKKVILTLKNH